MLSITKKVRDLTAEELKLIPKTDVTVIAHERGATVLIRFDNLVFNCVNPKIFPRDKILALIGMEHLQWKTIIAKGNIDIQVPLRIFYGPNDNTYSKDMGVWQLLFTSVDGRIMFASGMISAAITRHLLDPRSSLRKHLIKKDWRIKETQGVENGKK